MQPRARDLPRLLRAAGAEAGVAVRHRGGDRLQPFGRRGADQLAGATLDFVRRGVRERRVHGAFAAQFADSGGSWRALAAQVHALRGAGAGAALLRTRTP